MELTKGAYLRAYVEARLGDRVRDESPVQAWARLRGWN